MQWPFYLSFIPDCFVLSGRHSSRCGNRVVFNNNGATASSLRTFGQCRGHGGRGSWTEGVNGVVIVTVLHHFKYFKVTSPQNVSFFFHHAEYTQFGGKQRWLFLTQPVTFDAETEANDSLEEVLVTSHHCSAPPLLLKLAPFHSAVCSE